METIDDSESVLPEDCFEEIKSMCGWISFAGIMTIIFGLFGIISAWSALKLEGSLFNAILFLANFITPYLGYLLTGKASSFKQFAENRNLSDLKKALLINKKYFMFSAIMVIYSIVTNLLIRLM